MRRFADVLPDEDRRADDTKVLAILEAISSVWLEEVDVKKKAAAISTEIGRQVAAQRSTGSR